MRNSKTVAEDGFDFFAILAGMITSSVLIFLVIGQFLNSSLENRVTQRMGQPEFVPILKEMDQETFSRVLRISDADELQDLLVAFDRLPVSGKPQVEAERQQRRIDTSNAMLVKALTNAQRNQVIQTKLDAMSRLYKLDVTNRLGLPNVGETLNNVGKEFANDNNREVARDACLAQFQYEAFKVTQQADPRVGALVRSTIKLLEKFPAESKVFEQIHDTVEHLLCRYDQNFGLEYIDSLMDATKDSPSLASFLDELKAYNSLVDVQQLFENRVINGDSGQQSLLDLCLDLLGRPETQRPVIWKVDEIAQWFEQDGQFARAIQLYKQMAESSQNYQDAEAELLAGNLAEQGIIRAELVGNELKFQGLNRDGNQVDNQSVTGNVVVLLFWNLKVSGAFEELENIHKVAKDWESKPIKILAVDTLGKKPPTWITERLFRITFLQDPEQTIAAACPSSITPRAVLIDKQGKVNQLNVPMANLATEAELLSAD
ncbi:MAG: redoxin domain-containing protein [Planctomycetota bacterium]